MSDSKNSAAEEMPAGVGNFISFNHKYKKIICSGSGCGMAITFDELGQHLGRKHHVGTGITDQVTKVARKLGWDEKLPGDVRPEDGMAPQVGLSVWDGFRCKHCRQYVTIFPDDVDVHCDYNRHGVTKGNNAEKVRFQSWDGSFLDGFSNKCWVVDESRTRDGGKDQSEGLELGEGKAGCSEVNHGDDEWVVV